MRDLKRDSNYLISETGEVFSKDLVYFHSVYGKGIRKGKKLKINCSKGYKNVCINRREVAVHVLLYETFIGDIPEGYVIHHKDFNKLNNSLDNLVCLSNGEHTKLHNSTTRKNMYGNRKKDLNEEIIKEIIKLSKLNLTQLEIAKRLNISRYTVGKHLRNYIISNSNK